MKSEYLKLEKSVNACDKDKDMFYALNKLIELNPTYDLDYFWTVLQSTIGVISRNEYWFGFGHVIFINRVEDIKNIRVKCVGVIVSESSLD